MTGTIEREEEMSTADFRVLIRKLAATAGQELMWVQAQAVIHGVLKGHAGDPRRIENLADAAEKTTSEVLAQVLTQVLRTHFEKTEPKFSTKGAVSGRFPARQLAEDAG